MSNSKRSEKILWYMKRKLRDVGRRLGLEVRLSGVNSRDDLRLVRFLEKHEINTVLDVGANNGGFAKSLLGAGFKGRVISFEPLPQAHRELIAAASQYSGCWEVAPRMALDKREGVANFHVTQANTSSSLLAPTDNFASSTPQARLKEVVEVRTQRLDKVLEAYSFKPENTLLKLDVQGGEERVLQGASGLLASLGGVLSEMSVISLYEGQPNFMTLHELLIRENFELWDIWPGYRDPASNKLLQFDGVYFRCCDSV